MSGTALDTRDTPINKTKILHLLGSEKTKPKPNQSEVTPVAQASSVEVRVGPLSRRELSQCWVRDSARATQGREFTQRPFRGRVPGWLGKQGGW